MSTHTHELDLTVNPRREIAEKILGVSTVLFEAVKSAPLSLRAQFPSILRNNNFALAVRVTKKFAFLEVTSKFKAQKTRESERVATYRQLFCTKDSGEHAIFAVDKSRLCRFSGLTLEGARAFRVGSDFSLCVWDARNSQILGDRRVITSVDLLYVVGFGDQIHEDDAWQEFDALIRVTLADWSAPK